MDYKKEAAQHAVQLVTANMVIGLGAGSAIANMVSLLQQKMQAGLSVSILTSSFATQLLLQQYNIQVVHPSFVSGIDIYFDGCDQFDKDLHALKSGGGIHTNEKILAVMANEFILVGDDSKYVESLETRFPLVIEVMPGIVNYVQKAVDQLYKRVRIEMRMSNKKDGAVITENGNYLFDLWFTEWPALASINPALKTIPGIIETSLFYNIAGRAVIAGKEGTRILTKDRT